MAESVLNSWKDIAAHLNTSVRTAQRWEATMRLPVHRPGNAKKGPILAFTGELDEWLKNGSSRAARHRPKVEFSQTQETLKSLMALSERIAANTTLLQQQMRRALQFTRAVANGRAQVRAESKRAAENSHGLRAEVEQVGRRGGRENGEIPTPRGGQPRARSASS